jgi:hypothetical protein
VRGAQVLDLQERELPVGDSGLGGRVTDVDDPVRVGVGERRQEHAVHHAEDRRVEADAEPQGDHERQREAGRLEETPGGLDEARDLVHRCFSAERVEVEGRG